MEEKELNKSKNFFSWLEDPKKAQILILIFVIFCVGLFFADFFYDRHPHFSADKVFGFYAIYGFLMFTFIIFASKVLRFFVIRSENFYEEKAVDSEDYPKEQINREEDNVS